MENHEHKQRGAGRESSDFPPENPSKSYFLGIGISRYLNLYFLPNAKKDVEDLVKLLQSHYGFDDKPCVKTFYDEDATRKAVDDQLTLWCSEVKKEDTLLIYFSGHGDHKNGEGFWCMHDYETSNINTRFDQKSLINLVEQIPCSKIWIIEDRCHGGTGHEEADKWWPRRNTNTAERWVYALSSTRKHEKASDGPEGKNSPFFQEFRRILSNNRNHYLSAFQITEQITIPSSHPVVSPLFQGATSSYTFELKRKHPAFSFEDEVLSHFLGEQALMIQPESTLREINEALDDDAKKFDINNKIRKTENQIERELEITIRKTDKSMSKN
jgi:hypothetical protein